MISVCLQTDPVSLVMDKDNKAYCGERSEKHLEENVRSNIKTGLVDRSGENLDQEQSENESDGEESCDDESWSENCSMASGEDSEMEGHPTKDEKLGDDHEPIILTSEKSVKDQLKFIVCEESIAKTFSLCFKCGSHCSVLLTSIIGSYCKMLISCSATAKHNMSWSTGPLMNRLPAFNLLMAASILSTGMESNKTIRFMESMNVLSIKRREWSNISSAYVIPAVINVCKLEQQRLLDDLKGKPVDIASDMRVDSPGHCGLLGAGSTLDVATNIYRENHSSNMS